jgi:hypothetical protein
MKKKRGRPKKKIAEKIHKFQPNDQIPYQKNQKIKNQHKNQTLVNTHLDPKQTNNKQLNFILYIL